MTAEARGPDRHTATLELLSNVKRQLPEIDERLDVFLSAEEDGVYRYYHQSLKPYSLQSSIKSARQLMGELAPQDAHLKAWFRTICGEACEHEFDLATSNKNWHAQTRPILEGFWHRIYFLRQLALYGRELDEPPAVLPSGWAAVLCLYELR